MIHREAKRAVARLLSNRRIVQQGGLHRANPSLPLRAYTELHERDGDSMRSKLLSTALNLVPQHSFSDRALEEAAAVLGLPSTARAVAENGPRDIIEHLFDEGLGVVQNEYARLEQCVFT